MRRSVVAGLLLCGGFGWFVSAGDGFKPGKLTKEEMARLQPGLTLRFHGEGFGHVIDARRVRLAALHVPDGSPASILLPHENFKSATLTGLLKVPIKSDYHFKIVGTGDGLLRINGKDVANIKNGAGKESDALELVKGYNLLYVGYTPPAKGDATVRVYWKGEGFDWEPLPPDVLFSSKEDAELKSATTLREGRLLFATHGCANCHGLPGDLKLDQCQMPELRKQPPSLANAGHRLKYNWMAEWIANPHDLRPDAAMPSLVHDKAALRDADDIAAFLFGLKEGKPFGATKADAQRVSQGKSLFFNLGCVTCHHLQPPSEKDSYGRLSLHLVNAKFATGALEAFLRAPHEHYAWTRMPDFKLSANEAAALAAYLQTEAKGILNEGKRNPGDAQRGAKVFETAGCIQCHTTKAGGTLPKPNVAFPKIPVRGCLAEDAAGRGKAPDFAFADAQRTQLRAFLSAGGLSWKLDPPAEFSTRQVKLLQCNACHNRDGQVSRWYGVLTDEGPGLQPEYLPHLTWTGQKLHPEWTERLLAGTHDHRARPWLKARMPAFPARAKTLAVGLSHEHAYAVHEDPRPKPDAKLADIGQKLLPQQGGFNCVQCHAVGTQKAVAPFEAEGINLADAAVRLRYEYFAHWMLDPTRVDPTTRMTKVTMDGKTTALQDILGGDARKQFDAIWHYMQTLPKADQ